MHKIIQRLFLCPTTLSPESACDIFYSIYDNGRHSEVISDLVKRLDFHALSITLLTTTASHNMWDYNELAEEWNAHRARVLHTDYESNKFCVLSLTSRSDNFITMLAPIRDHLPLLCAAKDHYFSRLSVEVCPTIPGFEEA